MTIEEMREKKREWGYTYAKISELSGVPVGTLQKIFRGETVSPRYDTMQALEKAFVPADHTVDLQETAFYGTCRDVGLERRRSASIAYLQYFADGRDTLYSRIFIA